MKYGVSELPSRIINCFAGVFYKGGWNVCGAAAYSCFFIHFILPIM